MAPGPELGELDVDLSRAAQTALRLLPERLRLAGEAPTLAPRAAGTLGSAGLAAALLAAAVASASSMPVGPGLLFAWLLVASTSLSLVLSALDGLAPGLSRRARLEATREVRLALRSLARLGRAAETCPEAFGPRRVLALERAVERLESPAARPFVTDDLRGRAMLLLARARARAPRRGQRFSDVRDEVKRWLDGAAERLVDPSPARHDLAQLRPEAEAPFPSAAAPPRLAPPPCRIADAAEAPPPEEDFDEEALEEEALEEAPLARRRRGPLRAAR